MLIEIVDDNNNATRQEVEILAGDKVRLNYDSGAVITITTEAETKEERIAFSDRLSMALRLIEQWEHKQHHNCGH